MPDQTVTTQDSLEAATTPETGTDAPTNDLGGQDGQQGADAPAKLDFNEFFKGLGFDEKVLADPAAFKKSFDEGFVPKPIFTQKTQALAEEKKAMEAREQAIFEMARRMAEAKAAPQGPTAAELQKKELMELALSGDPVAQQKLVDLQVEERVQPLQTQMQLRSAYENAVAAVPAVEQYRNEISQVLQSNPALAKMAAVDNYAHADKVYIALAQEQMLMRLVPTLKTKDDEIAGLKAKLQTYEKERTRGLPSSTTRAGVTAGAPAAGDGADFQEDFKNAWIASGGRPEDWK